MDGANQIGNGRKILNSNCPSKTEESGETQKPFPNSEELAIVKRKADTFLAFPSNSYFSI